MVAGRRIPRVLVWLRSDDASVLVIVQVILVQLVFVRRRLVVVSVSVFVFSPDEVLGVCVGEPTRSWQGRRASSACGAFEEIPVEA
jgi:hypothetical protein